MSQLSLPDERMFLLMEYAIRNGIALDENDFCEKIDYPRTGMSAVRRGIQSFRVQHITNACRITGASADWVLGLTKAMFREVKGKTALRMLKEATAMLEQEMKKGTMKVFF